MSNPTGGKRDLRLPVTVALVGAVVLAGYVISVLPGRGVEAGTKSAFASLLPQDGNAGRNHTAEEEAAEKLPPRARKALDQARGQIEQGQFDEAITTLNTSRTMLKDSAQAYFMIGQALEGKKDFGTARDFYLAALDRDRSMPDAYWGVATTSEALDDLEAALGAMRSYLHAEPDKDPERLRIAQARSAIWEWESKLGRGPWGPTKGIPPGYAAEDIKRDGRGVAIRVPVPGTEQADGRLLAEIRHADKQKIFSRP